MIMKSLVIFTALFAAAIAVSVRKQAPLLGDDSPSAIDDEYIVIFQDNVAEETVRQHHSLLNNMIALRGTPKNKVKFHYHIGSFRGYSVNMQKSILDEVRSWEEVKYVERNMVVKAFQTPCVDQSRATWGLVRTTHRDLPNDEEYSYDPTDGEGVDVYIIDTGIFTQHPDFGGRAIWGADFIDTPSPENDPNGHGTHCAGTVMSNTWGLARKATAIAVRVLSASGSGSFEGVIKGIDWVAGQHRTGAGKKSVANMSLGGGKHTATNAAVDAAVDAGVHFAIAAGNEGQDACNVSPASSKGVTVAASDRADQAASFTNWGECVEIVGPGVSVESTYNTGGTATLSGTSMAAPHVAGVMAKYLSKENLTPEEMLRKLQNTATPDKITGFRGPNTPNFLVYRGCGDGEEKSS